MAGAAGGGAAGGSPIVLDPYQCIAKRNRKYASECSEVHLTDLGGEEMSEKFAHFQSLEVVWLSGNRLSRIEHLDSNFRIREIFIENNRLVSLSGLRTFKFLQVLLASNNQLRNLEKQIVALSRFAFLKKLDLFDNPVAEEPDYRLRIIYHMPQVEILDRHAVKRTERAKADEVVPNLDKVSAGKPEKAKRKAPWDDHSVLEKLCFKEARELEARRKRENDLALGQTFARGIDMQAPLPENFFFKEMRDRFRMQTRSHADFGTLGGGGSATCPADVLAACAHATTARPDPYSHTLRRHLSKPSSKLRGDVFTQTLLRPRREVCEDTGKRTLTVGHEGRLVPIGG